jgi:hypothetical protein
MSSVLRAAARPLFRVALVLASITPLTGCGPKVGNVDGKVYYKGKVVSSGFVTAISTDGTLVRSEIAEDGSYKLEKVPQGDATFMVTSPPLEAKNNPRKTGPRLNPETGKPIEGGPPSAAPVATETQRKNWRELPARYSDQAKSNLKYNVTMGPNSYDLKLE